MSFDRSELIARLALHEDSFVERKTETYDFRPTLVAFANSVPAGRVAVLYIGVRDNGEIEGVQNADSLQKKLQRICNEGCYPQIDFTTELLTIDGKDVVAVVIPPSSRRPHFAGQAYVRQGTKSVQASEQLFGDLVAARNSKVGELQKYRGQYVTLATAKGRLGRPEFEEYRAGTSLRGPVVEREAKVLDVNHFFLRLELNSTYMSEPLDNISISYDEEKRRPMILVRFDRP